MSGEPQSKKKYPDHYRNAHRVAFAPLTFQAARVARDNGLLAALERSGDGGWAPAQAAAESGISLYAARVLLEACFSLDLALLEEGRYRLSHSGYLLLHDPTVRPYNDWLESLRHVEALNRIEQRRLGPEAQLGQSSAAKSAAAGDAVELF